MSNRVRKPSPTVENTAHPIKLLELNQLLNYLGNRPYAEVFQLVELVRGVAGRELEAEPGAEPEAEPEAK